MQVEGVLLAHPGVVQAAAFGIENRVMGEMVHAAVTLTPGVQASHHFWLHGHIPCPQTATFTSRSMTGVTMVADFLSRLWQGPQNTFVNLGNSHTLSLCQAYLISCCLAVGEPACQTAILLKILYS